MFSRPLVFVILSSYRLVSYGDMEYTVVKYELCAPWDGNGRTEAEAS